jgi:hypothetical protein
MPHPALHRICRLADYAEDDLAPRFHDTKKLTHRLLAVMGRLLVQQEECQDAVLAGIGQMKRFLSLRGGTCAGLFELAVPNDIDCDGASSALAGAPYAGQRAWCSRLHP